MVHTVYCRVWLICYQKRLLLAIDRATVGRDKAGVLVIYVAPTITAPKSRLLHASFDCHDGRLVLLLRLAAQHLLTLGTHAQRGLR